jgi:hypothetical protein
MSDEIRGALTFFALFFGPIAVLVALELGLIRVRWPKSLRGLLVFVASVALFAGSIWFFAACVGFSK